MSFFPSTFNPRDQVVGILDLCKINTTSEPGYFLIGADGSFTDSNSQVWVGSQTANVSRLQSALDGSAPSGEITLSYFQDPEAEDVIDSLKELGPDFIDGQLIEFYIQPLSSMEEFYAPTTPPLLWLTRVLRTIRFTSSGAQNRTITATFETWSERRNSSRGLTYSTTGHAALIGESNPSLTFMPTNDFTEEKLFG